MVSSWFADYAGEQQAEEGLKVFAALLALQSIVVGAGNACEARRRELENSCAFQTYIPSTDRLQTCPLSLAKLAVAFSD